MKAFMSEAVTLDISSQLVEQLQEAFPQMLITTRPPSESANQPYIWLELQEAKLIHELGTRYRRTFQYRVHYKDVASTETYGNVREKLEQSLQWIPMGTRLCEGTGMQAKVEGEKLQLAVQYNMLLLQLETGGIQMQGLESEWLS